MRVLLRNSKNPFSLGQTIGYGGYGTVRDLPTGDGAAKEGLIDFIKVDYLIHNRVMPTRRGYWYAWPDAICLDPVSREPCAYIMQKVLDGVDTERLFSPVKVPEWYRIRVALNYARALIDLENSCYRSLDLPNAILHQKATLTLVDIDSLAVNHPGATFYGGNAKAATAPPEVLEHYRSGGGPDFETTREHSAWAFASLAWLLVMRGEHPFDAVPACGGAATSTDERVIAGQWPHDSSCPYATPRPGSRPLSDLAPELQSLFRQAFVDGHPNRDPRNRPRLEDWERALEPLDRRAP